MSFIFKITTTTSPQTFVIPCVDEGTFNATVDYSDGTGSQTVTAYNDSNLTHSFATAGQYTITIDGTFPNIRFYDDAASRVLIDEVVDLGDVGWVNFYRAFRDCTNLTTFNGGTADTSSVNNMQQMFFGCSSLPTLDLSNFNTSNVTTMQGMFYSCSSLTALDLSSFDTSSVTNMLQMFLSCSSLTSLNVSNFDTSSVTAMQQMFRACSSLTTLDLSSFDTSSVTTMLQMFYGCSSLTTLNIKHFDISSVTDGTGFLQYANNVLTTTQYDELLEVWAAQDVQPNVPWHFGNAQYTVETVADWYSPRSASSLSIINNKLVSIADSTAVFGAGQQVDNLIVGNVYKMKARSTCNNAAATMFLTASASTVLTPSVIFTQGTSTALIDNLFTATATTMYFGVVVSGHAANDTVTIDAGITVKEITNYTEANAASEIEYSQENVFGSELVVNGDFDTDLSGWTAYNSVISRNSLAQLVVDDSANVGGFSSAHQTLTGLTVGNIYLVSFDFISTSQGGQINIYSQNANLTNLGDILSKRSITSDFSIANGIIFIFTPTTSTVILALETDGTSNSVFDNVSVKEITNAVEYKNIPQSARDLYSLEDDTWTDAAGNTIEVADFIEPVTQGMTLTEAWTTRGTAYGTLQNATSASVRVDATISNTDDGILMEMGGDAIGLMLYVYSGVLYFQCGDGSAYGTASNRAEVSYTLPVGEADYIIEWSADTSNAVLYVNGLRVGSQTFSEISLAGTNFGTVGEVQESCAINRGGWTIESSGVYTNTITKCDIFKNQITSDV